MDKHWLNCRTCKKKFFTYEYKRNIYCSKKCFYVSREDHTETNCLFCDEVFLTFPNKTKIGEGKYCSETCVYSHKKILKNKVIKCDFCGKEKKIKLYSYKSHKRHFCDTECYWKWKKGKRLNKETEWGNLIEKRGFNYSNSYKKGRQFEYRVRKHFEKKGYFVGRSAGSKFPDLIVIPLKVLGERPFFIECKSSKNTKNLYGKEFDRAINLIDKFGNISVASRDDKGHIILSLVGEKSKRQRLGIENCRKCGSLVSKMNLDINSFCEACQK